MTHNKMQEERIFHILNEKKKEINNFLSLLEENKKCSGKDLIIYENAFQKIFNNLGNLFIEKSDSVIEFNLSEKKFREIESNGKCLVDGCKSKSKTHKINVKNFFAVTQIFFKNKNKYYYFGGMICSNHKIEYTTDIDKSIVLFDEIDKIIKIMNSVNKIEVCKFNLNDFNDLFERERDKSNR